MPLIEGGYALEALWIKLLIVCPLAFVGAVVDAIAGGGGLITLPAYLLAGLPAQAAVGTNKFSASFAAAVSAFRFTKEKTVQFFVALPAAFFALAGSMLGSHLLTAIDEQVVRILFLLLLPLMVVVLLHSKKLGMQQAEERAQSSRAKTVVIACVIGMIIGGYDGFFGPGTGMFLTLAFTFFLHLKLRNAMGNAKIVNLASNLAALAVFLLEGRVIFAVGIPAAVCGMLGSFIGARLALKNGAKVFKPVFVLVFALLAVKIITDFFK